MERKNVHDILSRSLRNRVLTGTIWITGNVQEPEKEATSSQSAAPYCSNRGTDEPPAAPAALWACPVCHLCAPV